jgi:hypothetical protein
LADASRAAVRFAWAVGIGIWLGGLVALVMFF